MAEFCRGCGARPLVGNSFCRGCGAPTTLLNEMCVKCGTMVAEPSKAVQGTPSLVVAGGIVGILAGISGLVMVILIAALRATATLWLEGTNAVLLALGIMAAISSIAGITGCSCALARKNFPFRLVGAVSASRSIVPSGAFLLCSPRDIRNTGDCFS